MYILRTQLSIAPLRCGVGKGAPNSTGNVMHPAPGNPETEVESPHRKGASAPPPQGRGGGDVSKLLDVK